MTAPAPGLVTHPYTRVWVAGTYRDLRTGVPLAGRNLHAVPASRWFADLDRRRVLGPDTVVQATDGAGFVAVQLEAVFDDPQLVPTGVRWNITDPLRRQFPLEVSIYTPPWRPEDPALAGHPLAGKPVIWLSDALPPPTSDGLPTIQRVTGPEGPVGPAGPPLAAPIQVPYAASLAYDVSRGDHHRTVLTGPLHLDRPVGAADGARLVVELQQDGVGGWPISLDDAFETGFDIVSAQPSPAPHRRTYLLALYSEPQDAWDLVGVVRGYRGTP